MEKKSQKSWLDILDDGTPMIDWEQVLRKAIRFDQGQRDSDACMAKVLVSVQRSSFERGYEAGINTTHPQAHLLSMTMGNA